MTQHAHHHGAHHHHDAHHHGHDDSELADTLDLDAKVFGPYLDELIAWVQGHAPRAPRTVADMGAGTGAGSLALARRFATAEIVAIDRSDVMLDRLRSAAREQGLADRVRVAQADLDAAWPAIGAVDVVWAASSLHHVADPGRVLRDILAALNPGGLLAVVEMDTLPGFLPDDLGMGRPGLETRCHQAAAQAGWNAHPDWGPHLERAGFEPAGQRSFTIKPGTAAEGAVPPGAARYAQAMLGRFRTALQDRLAADDLDTLDRLLAGDSPDGLLNRRDLVIRGSRTVWAARKPAA
ncbi:class I SAM-dependent methyltransferase [Nonomuraea zeae]|uniref:Class I SAM-dependent methyltransferase n=1 Tax=Nonomuraea zeae TaxID=1642303 RepID=A0A5S4GGD1_9ACTN|nr:class I SAM-dependent methyltransferase [Nonomuraea zeae]TMR31993.1 class I SAM-dependent methyltransferase [Nonomuraea zeae]